MSGSIVEVASQVRGVSEFYDGRSGEYLGVGVPSLEVSE